MNQIKMETVEDRNLELFQLVPQTGATQVEILSSSSDVQSKLESLEGHVTIIRSHLEKKPRKMTMAILNDKLDLIIDVLQRNGLK